LIQDVYEPLGAYRDEFRDKFARLTREKFRELTERSGIDVDANRRQVAVVERLQEKLASARNRRSTFGILMALAFVGCVFAFVFLAMSENLTTEAQAGCGIGAVAGFALGLWMVVLYHNVSGRIKALEVEEAAERRKAWEQMAPLNRLYTWDVTVKLIEATVPRLEFDPFFTAKRLRDLQRIYGWDGSFNDGKSIVFAQSGVINGNPFLFGEYLEQDWGEETYYGSIQISWTETEEDSEGRLRRVTRHQTLTASVVKPIPTYSRNKLVVYGNDAAPNLTFSRQPSGLDDDDLFDGFRKRWRLHKLKKFSQNLEDDSDFTLMANHEFETWFRAKDRDNEVEFRLLFTALAQTQMMALMKDQKIGYGDDFAFIKDHRLNYLYPKHLRDAAIDTAPERFHDWNYDRAAHVFIAFNEKYFKDAYFALAPVLAIPLYQQTRTHEEIWKDVIDQEGSCFWEHEALANYYGGDRFRHPDCITENVLKTEVVNRRDGVSDVAVTAYGYRGEDRVDYEEVYGGDGNYHTVPVKWVEYLPVERTSRMRLSEAEKPGGDFMSGFDGSAAALFRRGIRSYL